MSRCSFSNFPTHLVSFWFAIPSLPVHCRNCLSAFSSPRGKYLRWVFFSHYLQRASRERYLPDLVQPRSCLKFALGDVRLRHKTQSLNAPNKFRQRWKIPASWQWIIHTCGELATVYRWHWKDKRSASCYIVTKGGLTGSGGISVISGWDELGNPIC